MDHGRGTALTSVERLRKTPRRKALITTGRALHRRVLSPGRRWPFSFSPFSGSDRSIPATAPVPRTQSPDGYRQRCARSGVPGRARPRLRQGDDPHRRDDARRGYDDRLRHLHRVGRHVAHTGLAVPSAHGVAAHRRDDAARCARLRRDGGDVSARRRSIRVPSRGDGTADGVPVRLDPLRRHPDGHHRRRGRRLRSLPRCALARDHARPLRVVPAVRRADCRWPDRTRAHAAASHRARIHLGAHMDQPAWREGRQIRPDHADDREDRRTRRARDARTHGRSQRRRGRGEFRQRLLRRRRHLRRRRILQRLRDRVRRGARRVALLERFLARRHVGSGRSEGCDAQPAARADARHRPRDAALPHGQCLVPERAAVRPVAERATGPRGHCRRPGHLRTVGCDAHGGGDPRLHLRLQQRTHPRRCARLLGDGEGRTLLQEGGHTQQDRRSCLGARRPGHLDQRALSHRHLRPAARLRDLRGAHLLRAHHGGTLPAAHQAS